MFVRDDPVVDLTPACPRASISRSALVQDDCGRDVAMSVLRVSWSLYMKRPAGKPRFSELLQAQVKGSEPLAELHDWLRSSAR